MLLILVQVVNVTPRYAKMRSADKEVRRSLSNL